MSLSRRCHRNPVLSSDLSGCGGAGCAEAEGEGESEGPRERLCVGGNDGDLTVCAMM